MSRYPDKIGTSGQGFSEIAGGVFNFTLPGDISATERYYTEDIAEPTFHLNHEDSTITVPTGPGLGVTVLPDRVKKYRRRYQAFAASI